PGFVYVPAGDAMIGSAAEDAWRRAFFLAPPIHRRHIGAFLIALDETTFGEWIDYLESLPPAERDRRMPRPGNWWVVELRRLGPDRYRLSMTPATIEVHAETG